MAADRTRAITADARARIDALLERGRRADAAEELLRGIENTRRRGLKPEDVELLLSAVEAYITAGRA